MSKNTQVPTVSQLKLVDLRPDHELQSRKATDPRVCNEYAEAMKGGAKFPPITVFNVDGICWVVDGIHTLHAARAADIDSIDCRIHTGSLDETKWFSYSVNQAHGLRRSSADKEKAVTAALLHPTGQGMSAREIAEHVGVSDPFVGKCRKKLEASGQLRTVSSRTGKDGRTRKTSKIDKTGPGGDAPAKNRTKVAAAIAPDLAEAPVAAPQADAEPQRELSPPETFEFEPAEDESLEVETDNVDSPHAAGGAIQCAKAAIACLERIKSGDPDMGKALAKVEAWIAERRKAK